MKMTMIFHLPVKRTFIFRYIDIRPLSANPTKWSNTLTQFVSKNRRIVGVCLTIFGDWRLKG